MIFTSDLGAPEGPVALPDGSWLIVEAAAGRGCVTRLSADGRSKSVIKQTGRPNGLAVDAEGVIWVAESKVPSLLRLTMDGKCDVVADGCDGEPFMFPNDLCFGPDGALYLTDSGVHIDSFAVNNEIRPDYLDMHYDGRLYRIDTETGAITKIDDGIRFTNGIAFGPDGMLYLNETVTGNVYRYAWRNGKVCAPRTLFGNVIRADAPPGWKGPDGMAFDETGLLYVAVFGQGDVTVLGTKGEVVERIPTQGRLPTNVAFALPGERRIHVTEFQYGQMEVFPVSRDGLPLWDGRKREGYLCDCACGGIYCRRRPAPPRTYPLGFDLLWDRRSHSERSGDSLWTGGGQIRRIRGGYHSCRHGGHGIDRHQLWPDGSPLSLGGLRLRLCQPWHPSLSWVCCWMGHAARLHADPPLLHPLWHPCPPARVPILPFPLGALLFSGGITLLNLRGIRSTARANQVLLVLMGFVLLSFIVLAIKYIAVRYGIPGLFSTQPFYRPGTFHLRTIASATSFAAFTYLGFDAVTTMAEDVKNPRKNVMLAAVSVCLFTGIFGGLLVYLGQLVWPNYTTFTNINTAFVDVTGRVGGVTLLKATALLLFVANVGAGLTSQVGAARLLFGMGRENVIPARYFARLHPVRNTPDINIILLGVAGFRRRPGYQLRAGCRTAELRRLPRLHGSESSGGLEILGSPGGTGRQKFFVRYDSPAPWLPVLFRDMAGAGQPGKDCRQPLAGGRLLCPGHANGLVQASDRDVGSLVVRIMEKAKSCA